MDLSTLRKELKAIGFGISTKRLSWGKHATYTHLASKSRLTGNVFSTESLEKWSPLFKYLSEHRERVESIPKAEGEKVYGLFPQD